MEAASTLLSTSKPSGADGAMVRGGFYCYLATPFDAAGDVDLGQLAEYVSETLSFELAGLTCLASTCEGPYLTDPEWRLVLETVGKVAVGRSLLNVGVGAYSTRQTVENAKRAKDAGATSLMLEICLSARGHAGLPTIWFVKTVSAW
jgi:dihydrodipicolinate synthase/N-acetylneuraminate lyase